MKAAGLLASLAVAAATLAVGTAPAAAGTVTIGQTGTGYGCGPNAIWWQSSGGSYTIPAGNWTVTSWSIDGASGGQVAAVLLRPSGGGSYTVVGVSTTETLTANVVNTFATSLPSRGGDIIGISSVGGFGCAAIGGAGDSVSWGGFPPAGVGDSVDTDSTFANALLNLSATLVPGADTAVPQVDAEFVCYSRYEQDGGAVFPASQAESLLAGGQWAPSAVAGNVAGADNVGAYHLECNPPSSLVPTGSYVGDGGDVVDASLAGPGYYAIVG